MKTIISESMKEDVIQAVEILKKGGIILYPTDTVWGIGCDATNEQAVQRIYDLKKSDDKKSMLVLLDNLDKVSLYVDRVPDVAWDIFELADRPTTLILSNAKRIVNILVPEEGTIGIRVTNHEFCKQILRRLNRPLVSTSANIAGEKTPIDRAGISKEITDGVDLIIDKKYEGSPTRKPSSIIQITEDARVKIIR